MSKNANTTLYTYQGDRLHLSLEGDDCRAIFRIREQPLTELRWQQSSECLDTTLIAVDLQYSVLQALHNSVRNNITYTAYGHHTDDGHPRSLLGFNGQRRETVTGHYLLGNGYRAYNPVLMRFHSPDNLSPFEEGGINAFAYCGADPVNRSDSSGHVWHLIRSGLKGIGNKIRWRPDLPFRRQSGTGQAHESAVPPTNGSKIAPPPILLSRRQFDPSAVNRELKSSQNSVISARSSAGLEFSASTHTAIQAPAHSANRPTATTSPLLNVSTRARTLEAHKTTDVPAKAKHLRQSNELHPPSRRHSA